MTHARRWTAGVVSILASTVAFGGRVGAQEPQKQDTEGPILKPLTPDPDAESPREQMIRLFHEVERSLEAIDVGLAEAGAGEAALGEGKESGIDKLLHATSEKGKQAVDGIDRILQLAQEMSGKPGGSCRSAMATGQSSPGDHPKGQEQKRGPSEGERTPEAPQAEEPQQKPGGDSPEQPQPQGQKPDDKGQNPPTGRNQPDSPRADEGGPAVSPTEDAERWGMLPERVRQIFRNQITDDLPVQYRDWIDSYYRRMNRTR